MLYEHSNGKERERRQLSENSPDRTARSHKSSGLELQLEVETWKVWVKEVIDETLNSDYIDINWILSQRLLDCWTEEPFVLRRRKEKSLTLQEATKLIAVLWHTEGKQVAQKRVWSYTLVLAKF